MVKVKLTKTQLEFLYLFTIGYSDQEIFRTLNVNKLVGINIKKRVKLKLSKKYKTDDWNLIIKKCFLDNTLNKNDFIQSKVINLANQFTNKIYTKKKNKNIIAEKELNYIQKSVSDFINNCNQPNISNP